VQRKLVMEAASKQFALVFNSKLEDMISKITEETEGLEKRVREPEKQQAEREKLKKRIKTLEEAMGKLHDLFSSVDYEGEAQESN
jgi:septal ring factor EnvC (AmiA/AmiB activator)